MTLPAPIHYWNFDEQSGNVIVDSVGGLRATIDRAAFVPGKWKTALRIGGADGARTVAINAPDLPPPWSLTAWIRRDGATSGSSLLSSNSVAVKLEQWGADGKLGLTKFGVADLSFNGSLPLREWGHLVIVSDGANTKFYVNGTLAGTIADSIGLPRTHLGATGGWYEVADATIEELRLYNVALTPEQAAEAYGLAPPADKPQMVVKESGTTQTSGSSINLGSANVGTDGSTKTFTISNDGLGDLDITSISIENNPSYVLSPASTATVLKKGESATFTVTFKPQSASPGSATVSIVSNDPTNPTFRIGFSGTGVSTARPRIDVVESGGPTLSHNGTSNLGTTGNNTTLSKTFSITNRGDANLEIRSISLNAQSAFTLNPNPSAQTLTPGQSMTFGVDFRVASGTGDSEAQMTITSSDPSQGSFLVRLRATLDNSARMLVKREFELTSASILNGQTMAFDKGRDAQFGFVFFIHNTGNDDLVLSEFTTNNGAIVNTRMGTMRTLTGSSQPATVYGKRTASINSGIFFVARVPEGPQTTVVSFKTNDPAQPRYSFTIIGPMTTTTTPPTTGATDWRVFGRVPGGYYELIRGTEGQGLGTPGGSIVDIEVFPPGSWGGAYQPQDVSLNSAIVTAIATRINPGSSTAPLIFRFTAPIKTATLTAAAITIRHTVNLVRTFMLQLQ